MDTKLLPNLQGRNARRNLAHIECLQDLYRSIPSLEIEDAGVLDEFYRLNKDDPNYSLQRVTQNCGQDVPDKALFTLSPERSAICFSCNPRGDGEQAHRRSISEDFLKSNFWLYWRTMFAFEEWHSTLEMKLYLHRFILHGGNLADFSSLKFKRYNQYESKVLPLVKWLQDHGSGSAMASKSLKSISISRVIASRRRESAGSKMAQEVVSISAPTRTRTMAITARRQS